MDTLTAALGIYKPMLPEIIVGVGALALLMLGVFLRPGDQKEIGGGRLIGWLAVFVLAVAAAAVVWQPDAPQSLFKGAFVVDSFGRFMKLLALAGAAVTLILSFDWLDRAKNLQFEFPILALLATAGMLLMISGSIGL